MNILKKLLIKSKYVKLLENVSFELAFSEIPAGDMKFLELVIQWLQNNKEKMVSAGQADIDDEDVQQFA